MRISIRSATDVWSAGDGRMNISPSGRRLIKVIDHVGHGLHLCWWWADLSKPQSFGKVGGFLRKPQRKGSEKWRALPTEYSPLIGPNGASAIFSIGISLCT